MILFNLCVSFMEFISVISRSLMLIFMCLLIVYVRIHFVPLFPLITFVVNMMYLQIIYQREAIQIPETIIWKALQLACKQARYGSIKIFPFIPYGAKNMYWQIMSSCYCTFPMKKVICTSLSHQRPFL